MLVARVEVINRARALDMLATSKGNRPLRKQWINALVVEILAGRWRNSGQGILVDDTGHLVDGHHRLTAIATADACVEAMVVYGVADEAYEVIDRGQRRTTADALRIDKTLAELMNAVCYPAPGEKRDFSASVQEEKCSAKMSLLVEVANLAKTKRKVWSSAFAMAGVALVCWERPAEKDQILARYKAALNSNFAMFTPNMFSFHSQVDRGRFKVLPNGGSELIHRTAMALTSSRSSNACTEQDKINAVARVRRMMAKWPDTEKEA